MPPEQSPLYDEVKQADPGRLFNGVERVEGLMPEAEEQLERGGNVALRGTKRRISRLCLWGLFVVGAVSVSAAVVAVIFLGYSYLNEVVAAGRTAEVFTALIAFIFGVASTIAVEFLWHLATRKSGD